MEGNRLYALPGKNALAQSAVEQLGLVLGAAAVISAVVAAALLTRRILLGADRTWLPAEDDAQPVFDLRPCQNLTAHGLQPLGKPALPHPAP